MNKTAITIFGEVLFDCFPDGAQVLGGAPFNVAWHLQAFGESPLFISCVGEDGEGEVIAQAMRRWGMEGSCLQRDARHPTGRVAITLKAGEPSYEIVADVAYDFINAAGVASIHPSTLYHGSLGLRNTTSLAALDRLKANHPQRILMDVNLRDPWWQRESVLNWVGKADWVKLNENELRQLDGKHGDLSSAASAFRERYNLDGLVVTLGDQGVMAVVEYGSDYRIAPEVNLNVVDTVGAGDALTAVLILGLEQQWPLELTLERAQQFASAMVGQRGAVVDDPDFYQRYIETWQLSSPQSLG
jgi:fructokinase